jgi:hypothetical protein
VRDVQIARSVTIIQQLWKMTVHVSIVVAVIVRTVVLDAFGVCGGGCLSDINGNNICDNDNVMGCAYSIALHYNPDATIDIGTCEFGEIASDCSSDLSGNGNVESEYLLIFLADFALSCVDL